MTTLYKLKDYRETLKFEKEHPKSIRWDDKYKLYMLEQNDKCQGIWIKDKTDGLVGEIIVSWQSDNVLHGDSITVLEAHRGKGIGTQLVNLVLEYGEQLGYKWFVGEARKGTSWRIFENLGAKPILTYKNWCDTGEEYMSFKMEI